MSDQTTGKERIVAVPTKAPGGLKAERSGHFGHCDLFTLIKLDNGGIGEVSTVENIPHSEGGCSGPVDLLASHDVTDLIVAGMGARPLMHFEEMGIRVYSDRRYLMVEDAMNAFLAGDMGLIAPEEVCGGGGSH